MTPEELRRASVAPSTHRHKTLRSTLFDLFIGTITWLTVSAAITGCVMVILLMVAYES